jgi:Uma2 family endonuclease
MYQNNPVLSVNTLPTMYDLPSEDMDDINLVDPPLIDHLPTMYELPRENPEEMVLLEETSSACPVRDKFYDLQLRLLSETCLLNVEDFFIGIDMNLYYDIQHTGWYKRPDWFLVLGTSDSQFQSELRLNYLVWQESLAPFLMLELLSPDTEAEDLGQTLRAVGKPPTKWQVYEQVLRVPYYTVFDRYSNQFRMFCLHGVRYIELATSNQRFWFDDLKLGLGVWNGIYRGVEGQWLRWYDQLGIFVPTEQEGKLQAKQEAMEAKQEANKAKREAMEAKQEAEEAKQRANLLAAKLRELGVDPEDFLI